MNCEPQIPDLTVISRAEHELQDRVFYLTQLHPHTAITLSELQGMFDRLKKGLNPQLAARQTAFEIFLQREALAFRQIQDRGYCFELTPPIHKGTLETALKEASDNNLQVTHIRCTPSLFRAVFRDGPLATYFQPTGLLETGLFGHVLSLPVLVSDRVQEGKLFLICLTAYHKSCGGETKNETRK